MKTNRPHLSNEEKKHLKAKHRIELVMQEAGEYFEADTKLTDLWHSISTNGLLVNTRLQNFELALPGQQTISGDIFAWLIWRNGWSFPQAIRFLQSRAADAQGSAQQPPRGLNPQNPIKMPQNAVSFMSETRDKDKETSGRYEIGTISDGSKRLYHYLLKPADRWQEMALEIGGERMRGHFIDDRSRLEDIQLLQQYKRFTPVQDLRVDCCDNCDQEINWFWKQPPVFVMQERNEATRGYRKVRVIAEPQVYAFLVEGEDDFIICEECKRNFINYYAALELLIKSAYKREKNL